MAGAAAPQRIGAPPVTPRHVPEMQLASSEASSTKAPASSAGWPGRPNGVSLPKASTFPGGMVEGMSGVQIGPGATLFTRMPRSPSSCARPALKLATAPLVVA